MRRDYKSPYRWRRGFPLLSWWQCIECRQEFLWQPMWWRFPNRGMQALGLIEHCCTECREKVS